MIKTLQSITQKISNKKALLVGLLVFCYGVSWGQTTKTFNQSNGSWNTANNWTPSGVPATNDNLIIPASVTAITDIPSTSINGIEIQGSTGTVIFQNGSGATNGENFLTVSTSFSIQSGKTLVLAAGNGQRRISMIFGVNCSATVNGTIEIEGRSDSGQGVLNNGTVSMGPTGLIRNIANAYFTLASGATLKIGSPDGISSSGATGNIQTTARNFNTAANYFYIGSTNQTVGNGLPNTINSLTIANTGASGNQTVTLNGNRTITTNLTLTSGTFNLNTFTANRATQGGTLTIDNNATLLVDGANNFPSNYSANNLACSSTVYYLASGNQTIAAVNYGNLILSGSGVKTLQSGTTQICTDFTLSGTAITTAVIGLSIGGNATIGAGTVFAAGSYTHLVGGNWTREGTFIPLGSTIEFVGTGPATIGTSNFNHVSFTGSGTKTASGPLTVTGNVTIPGNLTAGAFTHTVGGNWTKAGTFIATGSTVDFNGTTPGAIGASNFNNLIFSGTGSKTAVGNLIATGNLTISNNLSGGSFSHSIQGNWVQNGPYTQGTSTISMIGTTAQTITATEPIIGFHNLITNNPSGVSILTPTFLNNTLTVTEGILDLGIYLTMGPNSQFIRNGTFASGVTGTIQGSNIYDVIYQGPSKTTGAELSGEGLRDISLTMTGGTTLTAGTVINLSRLLTIPTGNTLNMNTFALTSPGLTTAGAGLLVTGNTSLDPIPSGITWSFPVRFSSTGKVIYGTFNGLDLAGATGTISFAQANEGLIRIASGQFTVSGSQTYTTTGSTVVFEANAAQNLPGIGFANVTLTGTGDKTLATGTTISGALSITGTAVAKLGDINRNVGTLTLNGDLQSTGTYGSTASPATNKLSQYFGTTGIGVIDVLAACAPGEWLGTVSSDWFDPANWCGGLPTITTDVFISSTAPNQPVISANGAITKNLEIGPGATLTISGAFTLSVGGFWSVNGTFVPGTSTVDFVEDGPAYNALMGASNFYNVTYSGTGFKTASGPHTITGNLSIPVGGNFAAGAFTHTIEGDFSNLGFFLPEESTFEFGAGPSSIIGASSFYTISIINGATLTLSGATEIRNFLTLTHGTLAAGSNLTMG